MIRVLLVDDSPSVRAVLRRFFSRTKDIQVVGEASDGAQAVQAVLDHLPQVVVMDLLMPVMDGYAAIERIMTLRPTPIVVLSSRANRNQMQTAFEAIRRGAIEVLPKPEDTGSWEVLAESLPGTVRVAAEAHPRALPPPGPAPPRRGAAGGGAGGGKEQAGRSTAGRDPGRDPGRDSGRDTGRDAAGIAAGAGRTGARGGGGEAGDELRWVAIGASTGGPAAIRELLEEVPASAPASFLVVQHIAVGFEVAFAEWLNKELPLDVRVARDGESPRHGAVRLAPAGAHLRLGRGGLLQLDGETPARRGHRPSADELFLSCAETSPRQSAGVLLTGMGTDGVEGLGALRRAGAMTMVQDEASSVVFGMPRVALERGAAELAQSPIELARTLARRWRRREET
jgi:two-component system, chemotaxis family, protein-glutamate methylesterase/glutaminase